MSGPTGEIGAMVLPAVLSTQQPEAKRQWYLKDHLGSICGVVAPGASTITRQLFDSWGRPREASGDNPLLPKAAPTSANYQFAQVPGYTGHEMLEQFGLIHMNGRIYDPILARFLSADPVIADAGDIQAYNRYSYVGNSPLNYTDPTGYTKSELAAQSSGGSSLGIILAIAAIVLSVVTAGAAMAMYYGVTFMQGVALAFGGTVTLAGGATVTASAMALLLSATLGGFVGGFVGSGFTLEGALWGAATAAISFGIGHGTGINWKDLGWQGEQARRLAHGVAAGAISEAQGGSFTSAFVSSFAASNATGAIGPRMEAIFGPAGRVATAAIVGGTVSRLGGGKFASGAITSAFQQLFNDEMSKEELEAKAAEPQFHNGSWAQQALDLGLATYEQLSEFLKEALRQYDTVKEAHGAAHERALKKPQMTLRQARQMVNRVSGLNVYDMPKPNSAQTRSRVGGVEPKSGKITITPAPVSMNDSLEKRLSSFVLNNVVYRHEHIHVQDMSNRQGLTPAQFHMWTEERAWGINVQMIQDAIKYLEKNPPPEK